METQPSTRIPMAITLQPTIQLENWPVDYRQLNEITEKDRTPLPLINELKDRLFNKKWFTALDLKSAYNLIRIKEGDKWKTAFRTKYGLFEYLVMPFGLTNAPAVFQRIITNVLREYLNIFIVYYLDDILIFSDTEEEHTEHVHKVLKALQDANMLIKPTKRFANYYRRFIKGFSKIAIPLTEITKKDKQFQWNDKAQRAFKQLKSAITSEPVLAMFNPDRQVELETDASDFALGRQIGQRYDDGMLHPIAFYSHKMHGAELNYPIYDKEFLAIINYFKEYQHYLRGSKHQVKVFTDHKNIAYFATTQELNRQQLRYAEYLYEFDFTIAHYKGTDNRRADAISQRPDFDTGTVKTKEQLLEHNIKGEYQFTQPVKTIARTTKRPRPLPEHRGLLYHNGEQDFVNWLRGSRYNQNSGMTYFKGRIEIPNKHISTIFNHYHNLIPHDGDYKKTWDQMKDIYDGITLEHHLRDTNLTDNYNHYQ
ncbi:uncharacterized protein FRV6_16953 [Fusarium oxysporum]|uniref:Reverse transcriptase domain-containing protein n=1 Tax=Fusarium oxysporum TaxID=5507 RepID=A0A2H3TYX3_FUSOX|nr:uncharacterized protein FRV6_16953 [Fusarium oxysporum]